MQTHPSLLQRSRKASCDLRTLGHGPNDSCKTEAKQREWCSCPMLVFAKYGSLHRFLFFPLAVSSPLCSISQAPLVFNATLNSASTIITKKPTVVSIGLSSPFCKSATNTRKSERCHDNRVRCVRQYSFEPVAQPSAASNKIHGCTRVWCGMENGFIIIIEN